MNAKLLEKIVTFAVILVIAGFVLSAMLVFLETRQDLLGILIMLAISLGVLATAVPSFERMVLRGSYAIGLTLRLAYIAYMLFALTS